MPVKRGSQHRLVAIREVTYGTTPATPVGVEIPLTRLRVNKQMGVVRSAQIRQHPFVDRMLPGRKTQDLEIGAELQVENLDILIELLCGAAFATNSVKMVDALKGMTLESQAQVGAGLFDQFIGAFVNRGELTFNASEDAAIGVTFGLGALLSELDAPATIFTSVTNAADRNPLIFMDTIITIAGVARPVSAMTIRAQRAVDPLWVGGSYQPREQVPGEVTLTGSPTRTTSSRPAWRGSPTPSSWSPACRRTARPASRSPCTRSTTCRWARKSPAVSPGPRRSTGRPSTARPT
jgi:hypothetical protein